MGTLRSVMIPIAVPVAAAVALLFSGCIRDGSGEDECPPPEPAFQVNIAAGEAPIPGSTRITVTYGAGREQHVVSKDIAGPSVFCEWVSESPAAAAEPIATDLGTMPEVASALHCDLWTAGPAVLEIFAPGFVPVSLELRPERDDCGIVTRNVEVRLVRPATLDT